MNLTIRQTNQETFKKIQHNKVKNYSNKITQKDINDLLVEYVLELKKKGFKEEDIMKMTFTINYVNHQDKK